MVFPIVVNGAAAPIHVTEDYALLAPLSGGRKGNIGQKLTT